MGVAVYYQLGVRRKSALIQILDRVEAEARKLGMRTVRHSATKLSVQPAENCETLVFEFKKGRVDRGIIGPGCEDSMFVCSGRCETQFAGEETHRRVVELIRLAASRCSFVHVLDDAEYYETLDKRLALRIFNKNARVLETVVNALRKAGYKVTTGVRI